MNKRIFLGLIILLLMVALVPIPSPISILAQTGGGDADDDGIPDGEDNCPNTPGPANNRGCPNGDDDGDGVFGEQDHCPDQGGPEQNNGCPVEEATAVPETTTQLAFLPQDGCYIATPTETAVNIRDIPDLAGEVVGTVNPAIAIPAFLRIVPTDGQPDTAKGDLDGDGDFDPGDLVVSLMGDANLDGEFNSSDLVTWFQVENGFVASTVVRQSEPCDFTPLILVPLATDIGIEEELEGESSGKSSTKLQESVAKGKFTDGSVSIELLPTEDGSARQFIFEDPATLPNDDIPTNPVLLSQPPLPPQVAGAVWLKIEGIPGEAKVPYFDIIIPTSPDNPDPQPVIIASADSTMIMVDFPLGIFIPEPDGQGACEYFPSNNNNEVNGFQVELSKRTLDTMGESEMTDSGFTYSGFLLFPNVVLNQNETFEIAGSLSANSSATSGKLTGHMAFVDVGPYQDLPATLSLVASEHYLYHVFTFFELSFPDENINGDEMQLVLDVSCHSK